MKGQGKGSDRNPPGDDLDRIMDEVAAEMGDWHETEPPKGKIMPFPGRRQDATEAPKVVRLASLSLGQVCGLLGVTKAHAKALLLLEREALLYADEFVVDPATGVSMTEEVWEAFKGPKS